MTTAPIEARCDHCTQTRPLFLYEVKHGHMQPPQEMACRFCSREKQPLLCVRCWGAERAREESDPSLRAEHEALEQICAANRRYIANATEQADSAA
ncbi:hypothetical protein [Streptomyces scopuliridis]|uniref:hypothetical protein n=1 Tax=Streptomyces scopuliridis TaxID=452529 RepID=UPI0035DBB5BA